MSRLHRRFPTSPSVAGRPACWNTLSLLLVVCLASSAFGADDITPPAAEVKIPAIADEPKLIDPATVMPAKLAVAATVDLSESSLREVIEWLRNDQKLVVLSENSALTEAGSATSRTSASSTAVATRKPNPSRPPPTSTPTGAARGRRSDCCKVCPRGSCFRPC